MNETAISQTDLVSSGQAGAALGARIREQLGGHSPDALVLFASPRHDFAALLAAIHASCAPRTLVGCSSAGEFTSDGHGEGLACAIAFRSDEMTFSSGIGHGLRTDRRKAAEDVVASWKGVRGQDTRYRTALIFTDALAGYAEELVDSLTVLTGGRYQFVGGGSGDDARFSRTHVFHGKEIATDSVAALEILSTKPLGIGVRHGWEPASPPLRVTEASGMRLVGLNAAPAVEAFDEHARATGQVFDHANPMPFFLHNIVGIQSGDRYKLRVPLGIGEDGAIHLAADVPARATVRIMTTTGANPAAAASGAAADALLQLSGRKPKVAIFFDCVATRLRLGKEFGTELAAMRQALGSARFVGFNTYGQVARCEGQFSGFHNCTAVVCVIPE